MRFIGGTDINLKNFIRAKVDPKLKAEQEQMYQDKTYALNLLKQRFLLNPFSYIKWYLGGKVLYMWKWDNIYIGDVYQYPMIKKGFHINPSLHIIHTVMHRLHWPLYLLTLLSPIFLFLSWHRGKLKDGKAVLLVPFLVFIYFAGLLTLLTPLPRYAIPVRPFAYILGIYGVSQTLFTFRGMMQNIKEIN